MDKDKQVLVVGAGLVGSLLSLILSRRGYFVEVYEKRPDMRLETGPAGRSINLALSDRGWKALERGGIAQQIRDRALPMKGRIIHSLSGETNFQPYGKEGQAIYSVSRRELNLQLINLAEKEGGVEFYFQQKCEGLSLKNRQVRFFDIKGRTFYTVPADHVFSTDGAFSACRHTVQKRDLFDYSQQYLQHGYKELSMPPIGGDHGIDKNALHIWPRGQFMLIALPNLDGSFTCTLFLPFEGEESFGALQTEKDVTSFFETHFPDTLPLMPTLMEDFFQNPAASLCTIRCAPWNHHDWVLLLGDAAHAIVPFYGQGMNAGFEDCTILDELIEEHKGNWKTIFPLLSKMRKPNTDAIADLAVQNFIEMRDRVGDPHFLLRKDIERRIHELHPEEFVPLYTMVTFSHLPYAEAMEKGKKQDELLDRIMGIYHIEEKWRRGEMDEFIRQAFQRWNS